MKLTQRPPRPAAGEVRREPTLADRIAQVERRIEALASAPPVPAGNSAVLDQHVLDVIGKAIDTRLRDYSAQVERRLADLDAKYAAKLKGVDGVHEEVFAEIQGLRERLESERTAIPAQIAAAIYASIEPEAQAVAPPAAWFQRLVFLLHPVTAVTVWSARRNLLRSPHS